jgi:hypothetical protein
LPKDGKSSRFLTILESPNEFAKLIACRCSPLSCVKHSAVELSPEREHRFATAEASSWNDLAL